VLEVNNLIINQEKFVIIKDEKDIILPNKRVLKMVYLLASAPDKVFSRDEYLIRFGAMMLLLAIVQLMSILEESGKKLEWNISNSKSVGIS